MERCCGVSVLSLPVNLYNMFFPVCLGENCDIFYCLFVCAFGCFALTSAFICNVAVSCFSFCFCLFVLLLVLFFNLEISLKL